MARILDRAKIVPIALIIMTLLIPVPVAVANGLPTTTLWLDFDDQTSEQTDLEGVQLIGCDTPACNQPALLEQYGSCDSGKCLDSSPSSLAAQHLECLKDRCVVVFNYADHSIFKVVAQFSDRVRESDLVPERLPYMETVEWRIAVQDTALSVSVSDLSSQSPIDPYSSSFFQFFGLTVVTEVLVAALALRGWLKIGGKSLLKGLGCVLLANLISYPVAWLFWPSLGQFQPIERRQIGYFVLAAGVVTALPVGLSRKGERAQRTGIILTLILLPLAGIATLLCWVLAGLGVAYGGGKRIAVAGLPSSLTIALAEVFAVAFEAVFLYLLARKTPSLSARQAAVISLVMNASSFVVGLVLSAWL